MATTPEKEVYQKALKLAEHLMQDEKREQVDPWIEYAAIILRWRFRAQQRAVRAALDEIEEDLLLDDNPMPRALPYAATLAILTAVADLKFPLFDDAMDSATAAVYNSGGAMANEQLGIDERVPERPLDELISDRIDATTKKSVLDAASDVFMAGTTFAALTKAVNSVFADAVKTRADAIATTEIASAFNAGAAAVATVAKQKGIRVEKRWSAEPDACEICQANADEDWIDGDDAFPSGDDQPPNHPNCVCSLDLRTAD